MGRVTGRYCRTSFGIRLLPLSGRSFGKDDDDDDDVAPPGDDELPATVIVFRLSRYSRCDSASTRAITSSSS